jgi:long-chain acyl-CoA synthetase
LPAAKKSTRKPPGPQVGDGYAGRPWLASYPPGVPTEIEIPVVPLTRLLDAAAASHPGVAALSFLGTELSYRELKESVDRFAMALQQLGVGKGDRVALVLPNCPQNVISFYAALRLGAVVVEHNPLYTEAELAHQLADCGATVVVCLDRTYDLVAGVRERTSVEHIIVTSVIDYLPKVRQAMLRLPLGRARKMRAEISAPVPRAGVLSFLALIRSAPGTAAQVELDPTTDLALLQYTGGTTGASKGAMLTHHNLVANAHQIRAWMPDAEPGREVTLAVLPLFHAYGLTLCMNLTVLLAGTIVLMPRFDLEQVFAAIDRHRPTMLPGVPPIYKAMVDSPKVREHDLRSIRVCVSGAMKLPVETQQQFERVTGGRLIEGYGMTETSPVTHANPLSDDRRAGTIGLPVPLTDARIVAQDDPSVVLPVGAAGELAIGGPQVFAGYWNRPDLEGVFTADGYVLTGDIAVMDADGFFTIVDRKKELIIAGGFNIYPSEVEEVLFAHPAVADCCVVGLPDRYRGETVKAYVVVKAGETLSQEQVVEHCAMSLAGYKVPKIVEFRSTLPRTVVGKVLRRVLLEEERLKAEGEALTPELEAKAVKAVTGRVRTAAKASAAAKKAAPKKAAPKQTAAKKATAKKATAKRTGVTRAPRKGP